MSQRPIYLGESANPDGNSLTFRSAVSNTGHLKMGRGAAQVLRTVLDTKSELGLMLFSQGFFVFWSSGLLKTLHFNLLRPLMSTAHCELS